MTSGLETVNPATQALIDKMVAARQLSHLDAKVLLDQSAKRSQSIKTEEDVLRWLASEYAPRTLTCEKGQG